MESKSPAPAIKSSLRNQLTMLVIIAVFGAVGLATISFAWSEVSGYSQERTRELETNAIIFAATIAPDVRAGDQHATLTSLRAIARLPRLQYVEVVLNDGSAFAKLGNAVSLKDDTPGAALGLRTMLTRQTLTASAPIVDRGEKIGELMISADTKELGMRVAEIVKDAIGAAVFSASVGLLIALRMQRGVTAPIIDLARLMRSVRESDDFGVRAKRARADETGELVDAFNDMLDKIQDRDARLLAQQQNLQKIVTQRTRELKFAKEAAEAANTAKSDFLATMSHEIRTPMNGLLVMAELISKSQLPPRQQRYADVIVRSGQSLLTIINDILDFSKIEAGKLELEKIPVRPADVISDAISLFWERAQKSSVDLASYVGPGVPEEIEGDPVRLNQVISNLLSNALKFTERGSVIVSARRAPTEDGSCVVEFSVADTGVGISPHLQKRIFEAFSQADQSTTRKFGGTGLGLAICRRLVEAMGGSIGVVSKEGKGARFHFTVPANEITPASAFPKASQERRAIIAVPGSVTALMLARYLEEAGISAQIVAPEDGIEQNIAYADYIFGSPEFLREIDSVLSGDPENWVPTRICISELGDNGPDALLRDGVAEDLLIKPISRRDALDQIARIFEGRLRGASALKEIEGGVANDVQFSGAKILAADDSPVNREVVREALTRLGANVTLACDGAEAVECLKREDFDLILMDCSMPVMDGYKATTAIRAMKNPAKAQTPVIAFTAHVEGEVDRWRAVGMNDHVSKPFTLGALAAAIWKYCKLSPVPLEELNAAPQAVATPEIASEAEGAMNAAVTAPSPFNDRIFEDLRQMQSGDLDLVDRALTLFETHSREAMLRLAEAVRSREAREIASAAHALKSMSFNVGAEPLARAAAAVEKAAPDISGLPPLLKAIRHEYAATMAALPETRRRHARSAA